MGEVTKSSGAKDSFSTGYQRDSGSGKGRHDLLPLRAMEDLAKLYERGSRLYGDRNFAKGCPFSRVYASALRHLMKWGAGHRDEAHLVAAVWNICQIIEYQHDIAEGRLPAELDDMTPRYAYQGESQVSGGSALQSCNSDSQEAVAKDPLDRVEGDL